MHRSTLQSLKRLFEESKLGDSTRLHEDSLRFLQELLDALKVNLTLAGLIDNYGNIFDRVGSSQEMFLSGYIPSLAHKDLSLGNIVVSDDGARVKLIDPRATVPHLEQTGSDIALGNIAIDLVGYQVSLFRKHLELVHLGKTDQLALILNEVSAAIASYIQRGVFPDQMKLLCEAVWYSVFSTCKCNYCLAPDRKWLYSHMEEKTHEILRKLSE